MKRIKKFNEHISQEDYHKMKNNLGDDFTDFDDFGFFDDVKYDPKTHVGDGGDPNIYFVTWNHTEDGEEEYLWFKDFEEAEEKFYELVESGRIEPPILLEDRQMGTLRTWEIDEDDPTMVPRIYETQEKLRFS